jgi:hypothetical protein
MIDIATSRKSFLRLKTGSRGSSHASLPIVDRQACCRARA